MNHRKVNNLTLWIQNMKTQINWVNRAVAHKHLLKRVIYIQVLGLCIQNWLLDISNSNQIRWKSQLNINNNKIQLGKHLVDQIHIQILFLIIYQTILQIFQRYILNQLECLLHNFNLRKKRMIEVLIVINLYLNNVIPIEKRVQKQEQKWAFYNLNSKLSTLLM